MERVGKFSFFASFYEAASDMGDSDRLAFYDGICRYVFEGEDPRFDGLLAIVWKLVKPNVDSSINGQKAGSKGGRGHKKTPAETQSERGGLNPSEKTETPLQTDMDMDMDKERDRDMEKDAKGNGSKETRSPFANASGGAVAGGTAPPDANPHCPLDDSLLTFDVKRGMFKCPVCTDHFATEKVVFR